MSHSRDGRKRGEIKNAREKNREEKGKFQRRQGDREIKALVMAYLKKE